MKKTTPNLNYDFPKDLRDGDKDIDRWGKNSPSNLPETPIYGSFGKPTYRGGNVNSFTASISKLSRISENGSLNGDA